MAQASNVDKQLRERRGLISAYGRALRAKDTFLVLATTVGVVLGLLFVYGLIQSHWQDGAVRGAYLIGIGVAILGLVVVVKFAKTNFIEPDRALRKWLQNVCDGDPEVRIDLPDEHRHFAELDFHTSNLGAALSQLSSEMDALVASQTARLAQKNRSLDLLFSVTTDISRAASLSTILDTVCRRLANWYEDARVSAYLAADGEVTLAVQRVWPESTEVEASSADRVGDRGDPETAGTYAPASVSLNRLKAVCYERIADGQYRYRTNIPFYLNEETGGFIAVESTVQFPAGESETQQLLQSISEQVSLYLEKQRAMDESKTVHAERERSALAADIHDSLAQTLTALRYQTSLIEESLQATGASKLIPEIDRLKGTIGEANQEVRELIGEYRRPLADGGFREAVQATVDQFQRRTKARVFFQADSEVFGFTRRERTQIQRIVSESLNNAINYAEATVIRVYIGVDNNGFRKVLIEDDGVGFSYRGDDRHAGTQIGAGSDACIEPGAKLVARAAKRDKGAGAPGRHIGLSIMQERAATVGANLQIESEPGEGTRVSVELPPKTAFT